MALSQRDIFAHPFFSFSDLSRFFDDLSGVSTTNQGQGIQTNQVQQSAWSFRPRTNIHVDEAQNLVTASFDLPGLQKQDVSIELRDSESVLSISGQTAQSEERKDEQGGFVIKERREGRFARTVPVSKGLKPTDIQAKMENGVLTVTFPYKSPEQEAKKINIA